MDFLLELAIISTWVCGLRIATGEGMILNSVDTYLSIKLPKYLYKPIIGCAYCMASIHGTLIHFYLGGSLAYLPLVVVCSVVIIGILIKIHDKL